MKNVSRIKLSEFFKQFAPSHILGTTYTLSLAFFESVVLPIVNKTNLQRCLVICDKKGFQRATEEAAALIGAAQGYMAIAAPTSYSFHPKVWLMLNNDRAAILVGSGNLTQSGFMKNLELFDIIQFQKNNKGSISAAEEINIFLKGLLALWDDVSDASILAVETLREMSKILENIINGMEDDDTQKISFINNFLGPIVDQLPSLSDEGALFVAAPYFGGSIEAVKLLQEKLNPKSTKIFPAIHNGDCVDVPISNLLALPDTEVMPLKVPKKEKFAHLKLFGGLVNDKESWLFNGSVNCTKAALLGNNVEAGILRWVLDKKILDYFVEDKKSKLPTKMYEDYNLVGSTKNWFPCWASDLGDAIEISIQQSMIKRLPLNNVNLVLKIGVRRFEATLESLFSKSFLEKLSWMIFPDARRLKNATPLLEITGIDNLGNEIVSAAFVDDFWGLSSSPFQRSAWRATITILDTESLPHYSEVAAIFKLFYNIFDESEMDNGKAKSSDKIDPHKYQKDKIEDKIPIWPPIVLNKSDALPGAKSKIGQIYWCQKILSKFLKIQSDSEAVLDKVINDSEDDDSDDTPTALPPPKNLIYDAEKIWKEAEKGFESLEKRLIKLIINKEHATNLWAITVLILLATLAIKRTIARTAKEEINIPSSANIIYRLISLLFGYRKQAEDYCPPENCRYKYSIFPSVATDLKANFNISPHRDLCIIIYACFAYLKSTEKRKKSYWTLINMWINFIDSEKEDHQKISHEIDQIKYIWETYIKDYRDGITEDDFTESINYISNTGWHQHPGMRDLKILNDLITNPGMVDTEKLSSHLRKSLDIFIRQQKLDLCFLSVDSMINYCISTNCPRSFIVNHEISILRNMLPVICSSCGTLLIPEPLYNAFKEIYND